MRRPWVCWGPGILAGLVLVGATPVGAQTESGLERSFRAFQNEMAIRIGTLEASIANLTDIIERLRREQRDTSKDTLGIIDDLRFQVADLRHALEAGGAVSGLPDQEPPGEGSGVIGVIRTPVEGGDGAITAVLGAVEGGGSEPDPLQELLGEIASLGEDPAQPTQPPEEAFAAAEGKLKDGFLEDAAENFTAFLAAHAEHERAGEAKFLLGEALFGLRRYPDATAAYLQVLGEHADSPWAPDSMLRTGMMLSRQQNAEKACAVFALASKRFAAASPRFLNRLEAEADRAECN